MKELLILAALLCCPLSMGDYCTPYPTSNPDPTSKAPPFPTLPENYHVHVEANLIDQGYTASTEEYYDEEQNRAAVMMVINGQTTNLIYSYDTNEMFTVLDGKTCIVSKLSTDPNRFLFGVTASGGKYQVYTAAGAFKFGKQYGQKYQGSASVRGILADHWQSCINWKERKSTFTVDYYFSAMNWTTVPDEIQIPLRADVQGETIDPSGITRPFHHVYDFYHYRPDHDFRHDDTHDYETPPGVICPGRNKTRPLPVLAGQYYYREEIVVAESTEIVGTDIWYDSSYNLVRWDYRNTVSKPPFYSVSPQTEIHDFNTGVAYVIDNIFGNCSIIPIEDSTFDVVETKVGKTTDSNASPLYAVRIKSPKQLFFLDAAYTYEGQRTVNDKLCDVFIANRTDFALPGLGTFNTVFEFYFLSSDWQEEVNNGLSGAADYPVRLILTANEVDYSATYNFYDFAEQHPDLSNFDITPCFDQDSLMDVQIHFPGQFFPIVDQNRKVFELEARLGIAKYAGISPLRIQRTKLHYDSWSFYLDATFLESAPASAKFHHFAGQVLASHNDKSLQGFGDADSCAYSCLTETDFPCKSFDVCRSKDVCYLSKSASDDGQLINNLYCDHYSRNVMNKTVAETPLTKAYDVIKDLIYDNQVTVQLKLPAGKEKDYRAMSIRNDVVRDPEGGPAQLTSAQNLQEFTSSRNKALRNNNDNVLRSITVDDCATACVDEDVFFCQSFEYCYNTGDCRISKRHPAEIPSMVMESDNCDLFSRNYTYKFTLSPGTIIMEATPEVYMLIDDVNICAKLCTDLTKFNCKSFEYCGGFSACALSSTHYLDVPRANIQEEPLCDHYSRNYLDDFKFFKGRQIALTNNQIIEGITVAECAKICAEQGDSCQGFDFCGNDTYCRISSNSMKNVGQVTIESNAFCNHYSRQYYQDGSPITSFSLKNKMDDSLIYGSGSMAALGIIMLLIGIGLTIGGYIAFMRFIRGQSLDEMKQNFVTMDTLESKE